MRLDNLRPVASNFAVDRFRAGGFLSAFGGLIRRSECIDLGRIALLRTANFIRNLHKVEVGGGSSAFIAQVSLHVFELLLIVRSETATQNLERERRPDTKIPANWLQISFQPVPAGERDTRLLGPKRSLSEQPPVVLFLPSVPSALRCGATSKHVCSLNPQWAWTESPF